MRKCLRCGDEMIEGLHLISDNIAGGLEIVEKRIISGNTVVKPKLCLCSKCGYIELYVDDVEKVRKFM